MVGVQVASAAPPPHHAFYKKAPSWAETLVASREAIAQSGLDARGREDVAGAVWDLCEMDFPIPCDWALQDGGLTFPQWLAGKQKETEVTMLSDAMNQLGDARPKFIKENQKMLEIGDITPRDFLALYVKACEQRRALRLQNLTRLSPKIVYLKNQTIIPSFFAYTEGQSDAQAERHFFPGAEICVLEMNGIYGQSRTLLEDKKGGVRDPEVSFDGKRLLFAWKKSLDQDDYHLYEMDLATRQIRTITTGLGFADYEGIYLPNGDIVFASTRCVQTVDCFWTEVSNLYTCDKDGKYLRRLGVDQVHTVYPKLMGDGRIVYTRWDYNDRGQVFPQPLFQMNPDGTGQTEFYGNNSWFPTTIAHARNIPGTEKVMAIFCGHHSPQAGKLGIVDPALGRHENQGAKLIAPIRNTPAEKTDAYGQKGELFRYPYPLNESELLVSYSPDGWEGKDRRQRKASFGIYWFDVHGRRELLVADTGMPCAQPLPLTSRTLPMTRPAQTDYRKTEAAYYLQDVYAGSGLPGVPRGTVKKLRVVALDFRAAGVGVNHSGGPGGGALISTPISVGNGTWDVKIVLGDARVNEDGSAAFVVPARTPVYFQALDEKGRAVQTMRSWSTLQPGEVFSCVGCHEHKNSAPPVTHGSILSQRQEPQALEPFYGPPRGFSFAREVQPILDKHCVTCHHDREKLVGFWETKQSVLGNLKKEPQTGKDIAFSLLGAEVLDNGSKRRWSDAYLALTQARPDKHDPERLHFRGTIDGPFVNWIGSQSVPTLLPPYFAGAARSGMIALLDKGHHDVKLNREEQEKLACWIDLLVPFCGDYQEANSWSPAEKEKYQRYLDKRKRMEAREKQNIQEFLEKLDVPPTVAGY